MSGKLHGKPAHIVVRCSGKPDSLDGKSCGREQAVVSYDDGVGVRVATVFEADDVDWLTSAGWRFLDVEMRWLCPFCAGEQAALANVFFGKGRS